MFVSLNWIKDFVDLDGISKDELEKRFILSTAEIEGIEEKGADTTGVVIAKILEVNKHPLSDHLHILKVDKGDEILQVVCGAPNVREGMVTALATVGGKVCGHKITKAKLAGEESFGMCCSEAELGIGSDDNGIMDIKDNFEIGTDIKKIWPIEDTIIEIDNKSLTNRPDLWGHMGIAREFSAIFNRKMQPLEIEDLKQYEKLNEISVSVEDKNCYRYSALSVSNVKTKISPIQMKIRLNYCGMRDINFLADMTNYLMLELGQPMHAFDNDTVKGINVIQSKKGDVLLTLEGEKHAIPEGAVLITNQNREPVAIAGIKGGLLSGITDKTENLLLESACFDPFAIRKASLSIGLRTDSSIRYEKSLDPEMTAIAIARFVKILKNVDKNIKVTSRLSEKRNFSYPKHEITVSPSFIAKRIGLEISKNQIIAILKRLEFGVSEKGDDLVISVPSFRGTKDISIREDLVEEVARMHGYDNIMPTTIFSKIEPVSQEKEHILEYKSKRLLAEKYGANEVHTYIWNYADFSKDYGIESKALLNLVDASNSGQSGIRSSMVPSLLKVFVENKNSFDDIKIFEIGRVVTSINEDKISNEEKHLAIVYGSNRKSEKEIWFELKKMIENISSSLIGANLSYLAGSDNINYHPVNSAKIIAGSKVIGDFGLLHPSIALDKKMKVGMLEIDFSLFVNAEENKSAIKSISKFQTVPLDFNFIVPKEMEYRRVEEIFTLFHSKIDFTKKLSDIYENDDVLKGKKSMTFSLVLSPKDKTLTSEDIEKFSSRLIAHMAQNGIVLRV